MTAPRPFNLVAELTYRCPLRCAYCSNPIDYASVRDGLDTAAWRRVFREASELGVVHVGLTGGEPAARRDLPEIVAAAAEVNLYPHLVTAGTILDREGLGTLVEAGLKSVQLSFQDVDPARGDAVAGVSAHGRKLEFAEHVKSQGLPLVLNVVLHRENLPRVGELIELAASLGAERLELANTQYHGWALRNRDALLPSRDAVAEASRVVEEARRRYRKPEILFVLPDYFTDRPKPCMGGWARKTLVVTPSGQVLPCHGAAELPKTEALAFWSFPDHSLAECWRDAPGMNAYRGEDWMPDPCRSCEARSRDFGGCRCQAFALTGDPAATDPTCGLSPHHEVITEARGAAERPAPAWTLRGPTP